MKIEIGNQRPANFNDDVDEIQAGGFMSNIPSPQSPLTGERMSAAAASLTPF